MTTRCFGSRAGAACAGALLLTAAMPASAQQRDPIGQGLAVAMKQAVMQAAASDAVGEPAPQDKPPADQPADKDKDKDKDKNPLLKFFDGTELSGFVDVYYAYNFNKPQAPCAVLGEVKMFNCLHNFDFAHNSFALNLAELALEKKPTNDARIGYRIDFDYGPAAAWIHGVEPGGTTVFQNIEQAYVSYLAPVAKGSLQFDFGEFVTPAGNEVIETKDNWNYTRSLLFSLAIPYYHMGIRTTWSPNDKYTVTGFVFNGWNDAVDNNTGKSLGISLTAKPNAAWTLTENYIGGPEQPNSNSGWRHLSDTVVGYTVDKMTSVALNYDYGHDVAMDQTWQGIALNLKYQANDWFAVSPRYEWTNDACTSLPGAMPGAPCVAFMTGVDQHVQEFTLTTEFKHKDGLIMRIEYRGDFASTPFFIKSNGETSKSQNELLIGWIYAFSTKMP